MTNQEIEQKKQLLEDKMKQMKAGAIALGSPLATDGTQELSEDDLDKATGGYVPLEFRDTTPPPPTCPGESGSEGMDIHLPGM